MRILIVGDFSSAGDFLRSGFEELGVSITHVAYQNGWRKNPVQFNLTSPYEGFIGRIHNYIKPFTLNNLKGYDAVIFVDYFPFPRSFGINSLMVKRIQENNKRSYLWVTGCDSKMRNWGKIHNTPLCDPCLKYDLQSQTCICEGNAAAEEEFLKGIEKIVPASFEYTQSHLADTRLTKVVPLPVEVNPLWKKKAKDRNSPIRFFHGLNRYGFKGTYLVEEVFSRAQKKFHGSAEFLIKGKMPYEEYTALMQEQDVVVDQLFNRSLGINSLLTMAQGKILVAGDPAEACNLLSNPLPPMVRLNEPLDIVLDSAISHIVENFYSEYSDYGEKGIEYVKTYHSPRLAAEKFMEIFSNS